MMRAIVSFSRICWLGLINLARLLITVPSSPVDHSSSTFATTRCELTLERRCDSNGLQNLMYSFFRSATFSNTSRPRGSFFSWPSVTLLCIKTRSAIATGRIPLQPLQQVEVSIRTSRSFNQKSRTSRLELTEINIGFKLINHVMRTALHCMPRSFCEGSHEMLAVRHIKLIQQSIDRVLHYAHYAGMASCISWHYQSGDVQSFLFLQRKFWFVWCSPVRSTDTRCIFWCCRFSHLLEHKLTNDAE